MLGDRGAVSMLIQRRSDDNVPAAITDIGCEREINEDRYAVIDSPAGRVWLVCDGMGGSLGGELAAQLAIDAVRRALESKDFEDGEEALSFAIDEANRVIVLRRQNPAFSAMGTTIVAALVQADEVVITHAGDSRVYLIRGEDIQQLTTDHTYVQDLVDRGAIDSKEALSHPQSHVLTKCLGAEPRLTLDCQRFWIWPTSDGEIEDRLVLCSDGLYGLVTDQEIAACISRMPPQESCVQLVDLAKSRGGYDNITLAVIPLAGQLRDERSAVVVPPAKKKKEPVRVPASPLLNLTWTQQFLLMMMLAVIGVLTTLALVLWNLES